MNWSITTLEGLKVVDVGRTVGPFKDVVGGVENLAIFANVNAGKLSIALDLRKEEGRAVVLDLDVNGRVAERRGNDDEVMAPHGVS